MVMIMITNIWSTLENDFVRWSQIIIWHVEHLIITLSDFIMVYVGSGQYTNNNFDVKIMGMAIASF